MYNRHIMKHRLNLELMPAVKARLDRLRDATEGGTYSEVFRRSLATYELLSEATRDGAEVRIVTPDGDQRTLLVP